MEYLTLYSTQDRIKDQHILWNTMLQQPQEYHDYYSLSNTQQVIVEYLKHQLD